VWLEIKNPASLVSSPTLGNYSQQFSVFIVDSKNQQWNLAWFSVSMNGRGGYYLWMI